MYYIKIKYKKIVRVIIPAFIGTLFSLIVFTSPFSTAKGVLFDALCSVRPERLTSPEILLLVADDASLSEAGSLPWDKEIIAEGLLILTEMGAESVVLDKAIGNSAYHSPGMKEGLRASFNREFSLIKNNVRILFEGIRKGSVRSEDSAAFVEEILSLADKSKIRLMDEAGSREGNSEKKYNNAARMLGRVYDADIDTDLPFILKSFERFDIPEGQEVLGYSVFEAVYDRLGSPVVENLSHKFILKETLLHGEKVRDIVIPLDMNGAVILEMPKNSSAYSFRKLSCALIVKYSRLEAELVSELKIMEDAGYFDYFEENISPVKLYEFLKEAGGLGAEDYLNMRERFFNITGKFLNGETQKKINADYNTLLKSLTVTDIGEQRINSLKWSAENSFDRAGNILGELLELKGKLKKEIGQSICIITPDLKSSKSRVKIAAVLADSILNDHFLSIFSSGISFLITASLALLLSFLLSFKSPLSAIFIGLACTLAGAVLASVFFIFTGIWLNPVLIIGSAAVTCLSSVFIEVFILYKQKKALNEAFTPKVFHETTEILPFSHDPRLLEGEKKEASIIAVRIDRIVTFTGAAYELKIASAIHIYHEIIGDVLKKQGGFLYRLDGEQIFASFGAPFFSNNHRAQAQISAFEVINAEYMLTKALDEAGIVYENGNIRIGIDSGTCDFGDTGIPGPSRYTPTGSVPDRARILSGLAEQYKSRILITEDVKSQICREFEAVRQDKLLTESGEWGDYFYKIRKS